MIMITDSNHKQINGMV